jgi:hypothetical protein
MKINKNKDNHRQDYTEPSTMPRLGNIPLKMDREILIQGIILSEVLGKPKAKRKRR